MRFQHRGIINTSNSGIYTDIYCTAEPEKARSYPCCGDAECWGVAGPCSSPFWWIFPKPSLKDPVLLASEWHSGPCPSFMELCSGALQNKLAPGWTFLNLLSWFDVENDVKRKSLMESWRFSLHLFLLQCSHLSSFGAQKVLQSEQPAPAASLERLAAARTPCSGHQEVSESKRHKVKWVINGLTTIHTCMEVNSWELPVFMYKFIWKYRMIIQVTRVNKLDLF